MGHGIGAGLKEGAAKRYLAQCGADILSKHVFLTLFCPEWYHWRVDSPLEERRFAERLVALAERYGLSEISFEQDDRRVVVRAAPGVSGYPNSAPAGVNPVAKVEAAVAGPTISAPIMGVFYRSPAPGEPPFVEVGDTVDAGQPVGMIEAMKVFSEVLAEQGGRVRRVVAENGALVQPGDPLIELEAS
jgi:biotin carboxyl carrier protein